MTDKHSSIAGRRRRNRIVGTDGKATQWTPLLLEMMESPAWRVLSLSARRVLDRLSIELRHHGGHQCDGLPVTYEDFESYGIDRHSISPAIREVVALGFVKIARQGRGGNAEFRQPTLYQTTFLTSQDTEQTHEWRSFPSIEQAQSIASAARRQGHRKNPVLKSPPVSVAKTHTEDNKLPMGKTPTTVMVKSPTTSDISGGGRSGGWSVAGSPRRSSRSVGRNGDRDCDSHQKATERDRQRDQQINRGNGLKVNAGYGDDGSVDKTLQPGGPRPRGRLLTGAETTARRRLTIARPKLRD
jgi:hypothetical protein